MASVAIRTPAGEIEVKALAPEAPKQPMVRPTAPAKIMVLRMRSSRSPSARRTTQCAAWMFLILARHGQTGSRGDSRAAGAWPYRSPDAAGLCEALCEAA